jgi:uncharacterized cupin superfamily protein
MVPEAGFEKTEAGLAPKGAGWFVLNAREARWRRREGRGHSLPLTGWDDAEAREHFAQLGVQLFVLDPGEPIGMYHWEADQEDFLVLSGEALLIVEGEERPLRQWDFVHTPSRAAHTIVGSGSGRCVILAVGSRTAPEEEWGGYPVDDTALRHDAGVEQETTRAEEAYARFPRREPSAYRPGWLPGD